MENFQNKSYSLPLYDDSQEEEKQPQYPYPKLQSSKSNGYQAQNQIKNSKNQNNKEEIQENNQGYQETPQGPETDPEDFKELQNFFQSYKLSFHWNLTEIYQEYKEKGYIKRNKFKTEFDKFCKDNEGAIVRFLRKKMDLDIQTIQEIKYLLVGEVYDPLLDQMVSKLETELRDFINKTISSIPFEKRFELEDLFIKLEEKKSIIKPEFLNYIIINTANYFSPVQYEESKPNLLTKAKVINVVIDQLQMFLFNFIQKIYSLYQIEDRFILEEYISDISDLIQKTLLLKHKAVYLEVDKKIQQLLKQKLRTTKQDLKDNLSIMDEKNVEQYQTIIKQYTTITTQMFEEELKNNLGFMPSIVLLRQSFKEITALVTHTVEEEIQKLNKSYNSVYQLTQAKLQAILQQYLSNKQHRILQNNQYSDLNAIVWNLIATDSANIVRFSQEFLFWKDILVKNLSILDEGNNLSKEILDVFKEGYDSMNKRARNFKNDHEKSLELLNRQNVYSEEYHLSLIFYLYFQFTDILIENGQFIVNSFCPLRREFLIKTVQNIKNGQYGYYNYQVISVLDEIIETQIIFNFGQNKSRYGDILQKNQLNLTLKNQQYEFLHILRQQQTDEAKQLFDQQLNELHYKNMKSQVKKPEKFILKKLSDPNKFSKKILICISGFTSENEDMANKWKSLIQQNPDMEVYCIQYASTSSEENIEFYKKNVLGVTSVSSLLSGPYVKIAQLGMFIATSVKDNPFFKSFQEATQCGIFLAHFLATQQIFPNCSISLIGFSLGTQIIASCLKELSRIQQSPLIQNVVLMGGVADVQELNELDKMTFLGGSLKNCLSKNDGILKYLFKAARPNSKAAGLHQIQENKSKKIKNYDVSHIVKAHLDYNKQLDSVLKRINFNSQDYTQNK